MAPRNSRVNPETEVRSPARSFLNSLDNFYAPSRDTRSEQATQQAFQTYSGILGEKADEMRKERRQDEYNQGIADAMREEAGQEMEGVKTGSIFRQHSKYYMSGLNETRGKAAAARFKHETTLAYEEWEGRHVDDDGSGFRAWMNERVANFMGTLGEDQHRIAGAMPTINEMAQNFAVKHTTFTTDRLQRESFEAYDEIVSGIFSDMANGDLDMDAAVDLLGDEADDMYDTDGAAANDRVVAAAIRYANIHNDPDAILAMAKAHDSGRIKLSQANREKLANAMDAVEADISRGEASRAAKEAADEKAARTQALNDWASTLAADPYAELPKFSDVGDYKTFQEMEKLQRTFISASETENPLITVTDRMGLELDLHNAGTASEKMSVLNQFAVQNPTALSPADITKYTNEIFAQADPGNLVNDPTVSKLRSAFGQTLGALQTDDYDLNTVSVLRTQGEYHYNYYLMAKSGQVDTSDPAAMAAVVKEAEAYAMEQLAYQFPAILSERAEAKPAEAAVVGAGEAIKNREQAIAEQAAAEFAKMADVEADVEPPRHGSEPEDIEAHGDYEAELPLEEQPEPFEDHESDEEYPPVREGFYGELIQKFTDGRDDRITSKNYQEILESDTAFAATLKTQAGRRGIDPMALLAVMDFETGGTFDTAETNKAGSGATGLIQFMPKTALALGTTTEELARMSKAQQLHYVFKYLDQFNVNWRKASVDDVYMSVLWPAAINKPDGYVIFRSGTKAYSQNAGLDTNGDGTVTKFEAASKVRKNFYG